ncbi:hypothetical protein M0R19_05715 [Candidatus Pacearchaeota archaeon]|nr:hypothetical protein [Candidatus Pacearchaeota archaeon]
MKDFLKDTFMWMCALNAIWFIPIGSLLVGIIKFFITWNPDILFFGLCLQVVLLIWFVIIDRIGCWIDNW